MQLKVLVVLIEKSNSNNLRALIQHSDIADIDFIIDAVRMSPIRCPTHGVFDIRTALVKQSSVSGVQVLAALFHECVWK